LEQFSMNSKIESLLRHTLQLTTDIKPTNNNYPTIAAGTPPDRPAGADTADAGIMAGVPVSAGSENLRLTSLPGVR
jgi:hypothetical protein